MAVVARKYVCVNHFDGEPKRSDVDIVEEEIGPLVDGQILTKAVYLSVDPYMRLFMKKFHDVGDTMVGTQIALIIESRHADYPVGKHVMGNFGWRTHTVTTIPNNPVELFHLVHLLPDFGDLPLSLGLGVLGMPGNTAYFGFLELCNPKPDDTVVVTCAAGAVGSVVGQIAKIKGCNVIGIAGSDEKCVWLTDELGFDHAINYKNGHVAESLKSVAPKGVDCYFDNVGGQISSVVISQMNHRGRIAVCGSISTYNTDPSDPTVVPVTQLDFVFKELRMEGFMVYRWADRWLEGIEQNLKWVQEGRLKHRETVVEGFDNMFEAFVGLFHGENIGKAIVKV